MAHQYQNPHLQGYQTFPPQTAQPPYVPQTSQQPQGMGSMWQHLRMSRIQRAQNNILSTMSNSFDSVKENAGAGVAVVAAGAGAAAVAANDAAAVHGKKIKKKMSSAREHMKSNMLEIVEPGINIVVMLGV